MENITKYGKYDWKNKEYIIDYVGHQGSPRHIFGHQGAYGVFHPVGGGSFFLKESEKTLNTQYRPCGVMADGMDHLVYLRDDDTGEFWSVTWQPVKKEGDQIRYGCRHGLGYCVYHCENGEIYLQQKVSVATEDPIALWDIFVRNSGAKTRNFSIYTYVSWGNLGDDPEVHGSTGFVDNTILYHSNDVAQRHRFMTSSFQSDGFEGWNRSFLGETGCVSAPDVVKNGVCSGSLGAGEGHCAVLQKKFTLEEDQEVRLFCLLGEGNFPRAQDMSKKYGHTQGMEQEHKRLEQYWNQRLNPKNIVGSDLEEGYFAKMWEKYLAEMSDLVLGQ